MNTSKIIGMEKILVSACLLGENCRYDGKNNLSEVIKEINKYYDIVPFCPEVEGGLKTPRVPSEISGDKVIASNKKDVTKFFEDGASKALLICRYLNIKLAILKENSPSCGSKQIYDGTFKNRLKDGEGITTALLRQNGIEVINEIEAIDLLARTQQSEEAKKEAVANDIARQEQKKTEHVEKERKSFHKSSPREYKKDKYPSKKFDKDNPSRKFDKKKPSGFKKDYKKTYKK